MILLHRLFLFYVLDLSICLWKDSSPPSPTHTIYYAPKFRCQINLRPHNSTEYHAFHLTHQHFMDSPTSRKNPWQWHSNLHHSQHNHCSPTSQLDSGSGVFLLPPQAFILSLLFHWSNLDIQSKYPYQVLAKTWYNRNTCISGEYNCYIYFGKQFGIIYWSWTYMYQMIQQFHSSLYTTCVPRNIYKDVYCSINCNCSKLEMTQCSTTIEWI